MFVCFFFFLMIRRPPRSTLDRSSAASDVYKRQEINNQLKTLENQAKKAEKYYEVKKEYREVSVELAKAALESFNDSNKELNTQHETETDKRIKLEAEIATDEAALEQDKIVFIEKEKELQVMQHAFNEMLQHLRTKENEKNLAAQRLDHLKERESGLQDFLQKAEGQQQGIEESIAFTGSQLEEEAMNLEGMKEQLMQLRNEMDAKRVVMDEKRIALDALRNGYQQVQRNQFEAEKKVVIADTSIQNLNRAVQQIEDDKVKRDQQRTCLLYTSPSPRDRQKTRMPSSA